MTLVEGQNIVGDAVPMQSDVPEYQYLMSASKKKQQVNGSKLKMADPQTSPNMPTASKIMRWRRVGSERPKGRKRGCRARLYE